MARTFSHVITVEELATKLLKATEQSLMPGKTARETVEAPGVCESYFDPVTKAYVEDPNAHQEFIVTFLHESLESPALAKFAEDVSKVQFDYENVSVDGFTTSPGSEQGFGFQTLPNGFVYYGMEAGGDWELPVYLIAYWDGKNIRGYVPKDGNVWNTVRNSAYGNDQDDPEYPSAIWDPMTKTFDRGTQDALEDAWILYPRSDAHNIMKRFGLKYHGGEGEEPTFDLPKIKAEIQSHITYKPE